MFTNILLISGLYLLVFLLFVYLMHQRIRRAHLAESKLKRRIKQLEELDHTKQVFLSSMVHQLRTPLSAVKWSLEESLKTADQHQKPLLEGGRERVVGALATVGQILKTSDLEIDKTNLNIKKTSVNLVSLVDDILKDLDYLIITNQTKIVRSGANPVFISGDKKMLNMAITNIFDNAFRYAPKGQVSVNIFSNQTEAILTIEDNGVGIDPTDLEFITFQKFYRGKNAMQIDPNESGIGLFTTRKIIELHGGRLAITSTLGQGTKVSVILPL